VGYGGFPGEIAALHSPAAGIRLLPRNSLGLFANRKRPLTTPLVVEIQHEPGGCRPGYRGRAVRLRTAAFQ
jgi:hypothetical protein